MSDRAGNAQRTARSNNATGHHENGHRDNGHLERSATPEAEFISIPEWARRVGVSDESGYKAARLGQIPGCFLIGRLYRVNWPVFVARAGANRDPEAASAE